MTNIYLVRHGEASEGWTSKDPPLSQQGQLQARSIIPFLKTIFRKEFNVISSPLKRCIETASICMQEFDVNISIEEKFRELPSPISNLDDRVNWLKRILPLTWSELEKDEVTLNSHINFNHWRQQIINEVLTFKINTIVFTHYVVINTIIGDILKTDKIVNFHPSNCSITEINLTNNELKIINLGENLETKVN
tara:strand:- start:693 stop:1271 length:579 start_codon:yes stop_codon:yes gene_type:complete